MYRYSHWKRELYKVEQNSNSLRPVEFNFGRIAKPLWILCFFLFSVGAISQNTTRAFRNIEKGEFDKALEILQKLYLTDSTNVNANVGLGMIYSAESFPGKNYFIAWNHMILADHHFNKLNEEDKKDLTEFLFNMEVNKSNWPARQKFDVRYKEIENKLIKYVREEKDLKMVNDFIARFPNSKYNQNVLHIRNYLEFGSALNKNTIEAYEEFVKKFPDAAQVPEAIDYRNRLAFSAAKSAGTVQAFNQFLKNYPDAVQIEEVIRLRNEAAFNQAKMTNTLEAYAEFIALYPDAVQAPAAQKLRRQLVYEKAKQINSFESYSQFIKDFPEGEQFIDVFNLRSNALATRYTNGSPELAGQIQWARAFDFANHNDIAGEIIIASDNTIILSGSSSVGESGQQEAWLMKLSPEGKLVWNKTYPTSQGAHINQLSLAQNGDIYAGGYTLTDVSQAKVNIWLIKVNPEGFKYFDRTLDSSTLLNMELSQDKELIFRGFINDTAFLPKYWLALYKESGKKLWERKFTGRGIFFHGTSNPTGDIYCAGSKWIIKTDHAGYLIWEYFPEPSDSIMALALLPSGDVMVAGLNNSGQLKSIILNKSGKKISEKVYTDIVNLDCQKVNFSNTGEIWIAGRMSNSTVLLKISPKAELLKTFSWSCSEQNTLKSFYIHPDGSKILLFSVESSDTQMDALLIKTK